MRRLFLFFLVLIVNASVAQELAPLKVMTYNIRYDNPKDGVNHWPNRKTKVFSLLKKYNPDILGVQEALHHQLTDIISELDQYAFVGVGRDDGKQQGEYSAILYNKARFDVLDQNTFWLSEAPNKPGSKNWDAAITRIATWAIFRDKTSSHRFLVINTHFDHIGKEARKQSAALLKQKAGELVHDMPIIITGDFNALRNEPPYQVLMAPSGVELIDPAQYEPPGTACGFEVNSIPCKAIDYIFITNEWRADGYNVIQDNDGKYYPSDHLPVMITLTLQH